MHKISNQTYNQNVSLTVPRTPWASLVIPGAPRGFLGIPGGPPIEQPHGGERNSVEQLFSRALGNGHCRGGYDKDSPDTLKFVALEDGVPVELHDSEEA